MKLEDETKELILPMLHKLFFHQLGPNNEQGIGSACLEFALFAWGSDENKARECLDALIQTYFRHKLSNIKEILEDVADNFMEPYWALYRQYSIIEATSGTLSPYSEVLETLRNIKVKEEKAKEELKIVRLAIQSLFAENVMLKSMQEKSNIETITFSQYNSDNNNREYAS